MNVGLLFCDFGSMWLFMFQLLISFIKWSAFSRDFLFFSYFIKIVCRLIFCVSFFHIKKSLYWCMSVAVYPV